VVSLFSLVIFYRVAQQLLRPLAATVAVAAFGIFDPLIYYSATAKQYTFDVAGAVLIFAVALTLESRQLWRLDLAALTLFGAVLVWFPHASTFGLAALGVLLLLGSLQSRDWRLTLPVLAMVVVWAGSLGVELMLSRSNLSRVLGAFHEGGLLVVPGNSGRCSLTE
jgi:hypothetical protein